MLNLVIFHLVESVEPPRELLSNDQASTVSSGFDGELSRTACRIRRTAEPPNGLHPDI